MGNKVEMKREMKCPGGTQQLDKRLISNDFMDTIKAAFAEMSWFRMGPATG
jgi:hypothetical protein